MSNCNHHYDHNKHPWLGRFNSWLLSKFEDKLHEETVVMKQARMEQLHGTILEIGPGNGVNFRYYPAAVKVIAVEPNPFMHTRLRVNANTAKIDIDLKQDFLEQLNLKSNSIDAVVCTLVLCTVPDPQYLLQEVLRILKPGGQYIYLEHVAAPSGSMKNKVQNLLFSTWKWLFEGCETNRKTGELLQSVGFSQLELEQFNSKAMPWPVSSTIIGTAIK